MKQYNKNRIAIIGTVGIPASYGGFETLTEHLVADLSKQYDITVFCSGKTYKKPLRASHYKGARLKYLPLNANGIQSIFYDSLSIIMSLFFADVLLILGVSGAWLLPFVKLFTHKKIIISIDGIEWKRNKWNGWAKAYLFWAEKMAVKYSHIDISDNEAIQDYTAERYGTLSRIIEYGADHTLQLPITKELLKSYPFLKQDYAFTVCRIEPENNIHIILEAFSQAKNMPIVIVGNWNNSEYGKNLKANYKHLEGFYLLDAIYDQKQLDVLRSNASLYIHGHAAGGTNPSLVEAMYLGLPILAYGVSYNKVTTEHQALYFANADELLSLLNILDKEVLSYIGKSMQNIAKRRYTWSLITAKYNALIQEVIHTNHKHKVIADITAITYHELLSKELAHLKTVYKF